MCVQYINVRVFVNMCKCVGMFVNVCIQPGEVNRNTSIKFTLDTEKAARTHTRHTHTTHTHDHESANTPPHTHTHTPPLKASSSDQSAALPVARRPSGRGAH